MLAPGRLEPGGRVETRHSSARLISKRGRHQDGGEPMCRQPGLSGMSFAGLWYSSESTAKEKPKMEKTDGVSIMMIVNAVTEYVECRAAGS